MTGPRFYLDTEFLEDGHTIDLISIALVSQDGSVEYYAGNIDHDGGRASQDPWLAANVLPKLPQPPAGLLPSQTPELPLNTTIVTSGYFWKPRAEIGRDLLALFNIVRGVALYGKPEIWADHASYDWVALCQIWGRMIDLPSGMPMFCMDLMQDLRQRGINRSDLPKQDPSTEHDALEDARWLRQAHRFAQGLNWSSSR